MLETKADLLLHPTRLRIIQAFMPPKRLTAQAIGAVLPDVPPATLYRHLNKLTKGGVLAVVERRQVRGTTEKVYALLAGGAYPNPEDLAAASKEDHLRYFTTFVATLLGDFARYLEREHVDLFTDNVGYRQVPLYLSDEEFTRMVVELNVVLAPVLANGPGPGRRRRLLSTVVMPVDDAPGTADGRSDP
jgi:DNA-binding transcriptional ArsR family regulator